MRCALLGCGAVALAAGGIPGGVHVAGAQACGPPAGIEVMPGNGATRVALDAPLRVRYPDDRSQLARIDALYADGTELLRVFALDERGEQRLSAIAGTLERGAERVLFFEPDALWDRGRLYEAEVLAPDRPGLQYLSFRFETGLAVDAGPPDFELDPDDVSVVSRPADTVCAAEPGARAVGLSFAPAVDDSDQSALTHYGFLTRAAGLSAPRLVARFRAGGPTASLDFLLSEAETAEPVCVQIRVEDGVGRLAPQEPEVCFDPMTGSYFYPLCGVALPGAAAGARGAPAAAGFLVPLLTMLAVSWRRRRCRRNRGQSLLHSEQRRLRRDGR